MISYNNRINSVGQKHRSLSLTMHLTTGYAGRYASSRGLEGMIVRNQNGRPPSSLTPPSL